MTDEIPHALPINRNAIISMIAGLLSLLSFCIAVAPIPFTGYICYPGAAVLGLIALVTGVTALSQIKATTENGRAYALIGVGIGGIAVVAALCATALGILLYPKIVSLIHQYLK